MLNDKFIDIIELNIFCLNVKVGGMVFGIKNEVVREVVCEVRNIMKLFLVIKLLFNVEDIVGMVKVCEEEGVDGVLLVNIFKVMVIDIKNRRLVFENVYVGLFGLVIKFIVLRMVYEVCKNVNIFVMGMGGIIKVIDVIEFIMVGVICI